MPARSSSALGNETCPFFPNLTNFGNEGGQIQCGLENIVNEKKLSLQSMMGEQFAERTVKLSQQRNYSHIGFLVLQTELLVRKRFAK